MSSPGGLSSGVIFLIYIAICVVILLIGRWCLDRNKRSVDLDDGETPIIANLVGPPMV